MFKAYIRYSKHIHLRRNSSSSFADDDDVALLRLMQIITLMTMSIITATACCILVIFAATGAGTLASRVNSCRDLPLPRPQRRRYPDAMSTRAPAGKKNDICNKVRVVFEHTLLTIRREINAQCKTMHKVH